MIKISKLVCTAIIVLLTFASCNDDDDNNASTSTSQQTIVVEVTTFDLADGVNPTAFQIRDAEIEKDFASQQPGFLKRMSGVDTDGKYVIMVFWETLEDADASIAAFGQDPTVADYFAMIDGNTFLAERYTTFAVPNINFSLERDNVIEITTFNINTGVDATTFQARDAEIEQDFASKQPGFIRRTSGVDANGKYAVIVFWETLADADASIAAFGQDPTVADYFAMINPDTFLAERFTIFDSSLATLSSLQSTNNLFYPEDITIVNNTAYVSSFADAKIWSFDLTQSNPTAKVFAEGETGFAQAWGLKSDGTILLSLLNNADFTGNPPGASKLVEYNLATGVKTNEWNLPVNTVGHTVSMIQGKYYVTDFGSPRIIEVDPVTGNINENWFTSTNWNAANGGLGGTIYSTTRNAFYISQGGALYYLPISNNQPGTLEQVTVTGLDAIDADGISWGTDENTLYFATNDTQDPAKVGGAYSLSFSNATTATASTIVSGLNDTSGVWYIENNGTRYLYVCESQFGALFGFNTLETPFNIELVTLN